MTRGRAAIDQIQALPPQVSVIATHGNLLSLILRSFDPSFGYRAWDRLSNPDVFSLAWFCTEVTPGFPASGKMHATAYSPRRNAMHIKIDDLTSPSVHALLNEHLQNMRSLSPPESVHALDLENLRKPAITFWTAWEGSLLMGCGALMELGPEHGEIKSMRTPAALRRRGAGRAILTHIIAEARARGYRRLSLETGSSDAFKPAQHLYEQFGFSVCGPFADYVEDPFSVFMTRNL